MKKEEAATQPPRILVVENTPSIQRLIQRILGASFEVITASNAREAFQAAEESTADLVLLNIRLGGAKSGVDVLQELRAQGAYQDVPFVAVTGHALPGDRERLLKEGFDDYIAKPFSREELLETIRRHV